LTADGRFERERKWGRAWGRSSRPRTASTIPFNPMGSAKFELLEVDAERLVELRGIIT
jgi:hypothetical protein